MVDNLVNKLYRSRIKRVFGGVAGGLADYLNLDPIIVRVLFIITTLFNGIGLLLYIIFWIVVPEAPVELSFSSSSTSSDEKKESTSTESEGNKFSSYEAFPEPKNKGKVFLGSLLVIIGLVFLADNIFPVFDFIDIVPILLIVLGAVLVWNSWNKRI